MTPLNKPLCREVVVKSALPTPAVTTWVITISPSGLRARHKGAVGTHEYSVTWRQLLGALLLGSVQK